MTEMTFLEAARDLGIVKCDKHFYYNNGSLYLTAAKAAVQAGAWPAERLEKLLQEQCWIKKIQHCSCKTWFCKADSAHGRRIQLVPARVNRH